MTELTSLSPELLPVVISNLSDREVSTISYVSQYLHEMCGNPHIWRHKLQRDFPGLFSLLSPEDHYRERYIAATRIGATLVVSTVTAVDEYSACATIGMTHPNRYPIEIIRSTNGKYSYAPEIVVRPIDYMWTMEYFRRRPGSSLDIPDSSESDRISDVGAQYVGCNNLKAKIDPLFADGYRLWLGSEPFIPRI